MLSTLANTITECKFFCIRRDIYFLQTFLYLHFHPHYHHYYDYYVQFQLGTKIFNMTALIKKSI